MSSLHQIKRNHLAGRQRSDANPQPHDQAGRYAAFDPGFHLSCVDGLHFATATGFYLTHTVRMPVETVEDINRLNHPHCPNKDITEMSALESAWDWRHF